MKLTTLVIGIMFLLSACSDKNDTQNQAASNNVQNEPSIQKLTDYEKQIFSFNAESLKPGCDAGSEIVCAINTLVKCTINPKTEECSKNRNKMPGFIFMDDESLERPTQQSYQIVKMKPIANGQVEVYTKGECNGIWFGLCKGNVIYVMAPDGNGWAVKDIYAMENL